MNAVDQKAQQKRYLEALLAATGRQNREAFRELYRETSPKLFAILIRVLHNKEEAADVLQEVYLAIWRRAGQFDPAKGHPMTWLGVITRNAGIDALRRRRPNHVSDECCAELSSNELSAYEAMKREHAERAISRHLDGLPEKQRHAVRLFYLEERPLLEVAEIMQAPLNTTKSWIRRGLKNLQSDFSGQGLTDFV